MDTLNVTTSQFLSAMFPILPTGALIEMRAEQPDGQVVRRWSSSISELLANARPLTESLNVWFGPGLRLRQGGTNADVGWLPALWVDADAKLFENGTKEEAFAHVMNYHIKPSIIVDSGHGLQPYWLLDTLADTDHVPLAIGAMRSLNAELSEGLLRRFDAVADASRMMRMPNTWNRKEVEFPVQSRIILFEPERRYSLETFPVNSASVPIILTPYNDEDFYLDDDLPSVRDIIAEANARDTPGWAIDALHRPDQYDKGDTSDLDFSIMLELVKVLTPGECEYVWLNTTLGTRSKVINRKDYRRRTIWRARQTLLDRGQRPYNPNDDLTMDNDGAGIVVTGTQQASSPQNYTYAQGRGLELLTSRRPTLLANFRPRLLREIEVVHDDGESQREYEVRLERTTEEFIDLRIVGSDLESERAFRKRLAPILPSAFIVYPAGWAHIPSAMLELAQDGDHVRETTYASSGWVTGSEPPVYVLPGAEGGISRDGINEGYRYDETSLRRLPDRMRKYGEGVRPPTDETEREIAEAALISLLHVAPASVIVPIITQILAGPLSSVGARMTPPLVHVLGKTGSFKTTLSMLGLSLFGKFEQGNVPETWTSTQNALVRRLWEGRDITLLIDDYKRTKQEPITLIQNYADSTTRSRMGSDQENRLALAPRGLLLSTGEDIWEEHESTEARTIVVMVSRPPVEEVKEVLARLSDVQERAVNGHLALVGGDWLSWLSRLGLDSVKQQFMERRSQWVKDATGAHPEVHFRLMNTLASLFSAGDMVQEFFDNRYPSVSQMFAEYKAQAWETLLGVGVERAEAAVERGPYEAVLSAMEQALNMSQAHFVHKKVAYQVNGNRILGSYATEPIGFYDEENLYLTKIATFGWLLRNAAKSRQELGYSWNAFCQAAREVLGPLMIAGKDQRTSFQLFANGQRTRSVVIPRSVINFGDGVQEIESGEIEQITQQFINQLDIPD